MISCSNTLSTREKVSRKSQWHKEAFGLPHKKTLITNWLLVRGGKLAKLIFAKQNEDYTLSFAAASIVKLFSVRLSRAVKRKYHKSLTINSACSEPSNPIMPFNAASC